MKLVIQIPCLNEEEALPVSIPAIPKSFSGIDEVEILVLNDGSTDNTIEVAKSLGVVHFAHNKVNMGLAKTFMLGLETAVSMGADIVVNTDADNQYNADDIQKLIDPILKKEADIVVGTRPVMKTEHWSALKKLLQKLGSWAVRVASKTNVQDAPSGFRAFSRDAALQLRVFNEYTYTLETIIQAGHKRIPIKSVPIRTNGDLRPSRLFKSIRAYVSRSLITIVRIFVIYRPFRFFLAIGILTALPGVILGARFVHKYYVGEGSGHVQSLILASLLIIMGFFSTLTGVIADLVASNRKLLEEIAYKQAREIYKK